MAKKAKKEMSLAALVEKLTVNGWRAVPNFDMGQYQVRMWTKKDRLCSIILLSDLSFTVTFDRAK